MTSEPRDPNRLDDLIHGWCDGTLDEPSFRELERLLDEDVNAAQRYLEVVQLWNELLDCAEAGELSRDEGTAKKTVLKIPFLATMGFWGGLTSVAAILLLAFGAGVFWGGGQRSEQAQLHDNGHSTFAPENGGLPTTDSGESWYVARVVEVSEDAVWGGERPREFLLRLHRGEQLELKAGIARIAFASGASVILHGPALFEVASSNTGRLVSGRMTGRAEDGNFRLLTEAAEVIDLGTEFGVSVGADAVTEVCVFDGEVDVSPRSGSGSGGQSGSTRLFKGMALRVGANGQINDAADINRESYERHGSHVNSSDLKQGWLSLVDVVAGGDGRQAWLAGAIDPRTGDWDADTPLAQEGWRNRYPDGQYKSCSVSPLIDGVFIPTPQGAENQVNSGGDTYSFDQNHGLTWGPLWSRRRLPGLRVTDSAASDYWGTQTLAGIMEVVETSRHGIVGMHADVGLTIDLRAIRMLEGRPVTRLVTGIANLDNSASRPPAYTVDYVPTVDFLVLVDGKLLFERRDLRREHGTIPVDVPIDNSARFLTLVSMDSGDSYSFDHLVLIDPELIAQGH